MVRRRVDISIASYEASYEENVASRCPRRMRSLLPTAENGLVIVDDSAGHHPGFCAREEGDGTRSFGGLDQPAERLLRCGALAPTVLRPMIEPHDAVLAGGVHPAQIEAVDPDAPWHQRECGVLGERCQCSLGNAVGREKRLAAVRRHGQDIDN